jgi:vacuolar-type H+-ATPase subunit H
MSSNDVFDKLFDVERRAEALVHDAQEEAAKRVSAAKEKAEITFKTTFEAAAQATEAKRARAQEAADSEYQSTIAEYRVKLEHAALDKAAFNATCERYLVEES